MWGFKTYYVLDPVPFFNDTLKKFFLKPFIKLWLKILGNVLKLVWL